MSLVVYPRRPRDRRRNASGRLASPDRLPAFTAKTSAEKIVVGVLAGAVLFYVLGKAMGLGRDPTED